MFPLAKPDIHFDEVADDIRAILESGWLTNGEYVRRFEDAFAEYIGVTHAISTTSATTALHLALVAGGIGPGDEVLVSDFTFPASGNAIVQAGATPVLVDCESGKFTLSLDDAQTKLTSKTKAIMPVDPFGQPVDMKSICIFANRNNLMVIEDAACAVGAERDGKRCGAWPGAGCFSFHPRKVITTGEGGMITTNDPNLAEKARRLRSHGCKPDVVGMEFIEHGYNYRLSEIQAALGLSQLAKLESMLVDRRRIAQEYSLTLGSVEGLCCPLDEGQGLGTYQSYVILLDDHIDRVLVIEGMKAAGVEVTLGTYAMHSHAAFAKYGYIAGCLPNSWRMQQKTISIPILPHMSSQDINYVMDKLSLAVSNAKI